MTRIEALILAALIVVVCWTFASCGDVAGELERKIAQHREMRY